jgi:hypothetical protein
MHEQKDFSEIGTSTIENQQHKENNQQQKTKQ